MRDKDEAASALNQCFLKIIKGLRTYEHSQNFQAWAQRIMVNTCIDILRKRKRHRDREYPFDPNEGIYKNGSIDWNKAESALNAEAILKLVQTLPEKTRQVFNLYVIEGYQHNEIAELLEFSEGTSKWHLSKARKLLKNKIALQLKTEKNINVNAS
jgi:RNA polymerase sigma-70 factor (ECF subfamily)